MHTLDCTLPAPERFNVLTDSSGNAYPAPHPQGRYQRKEAQEIADLQNRVYRVCVGKVELGHVKYAPPGTEGIHVAYLASAPDVGKEFDNLKAALSWVRRGGKS